jgi:hypothetical protein
MENLKGDYLLQIIKSIKQKEQQLRVCDKNQVCALTLDYSKNYIFEAIQEIMSTFGTLLKQL